ncbi:unnamed protein product [Heterobilharzia americana]|nr:unnamed protein product [Heterobilharzia americana]
MIFHFRNQRFSYYIHDNTESFFLLTNQLPIEPDGPSGVRAASVFHSTASKSTQTDLGYLLDRQAKKSNAEITELRSIIKIREETIQQLEEENARLSDSLKTILHNMNKPGNIDKNTMSNSLPIVGQNHSDKTAYKNPSTAASIRPYDDRIQQQQLRQPYPTTPSANQPSMMISPSQKCYMMSRALDYPPVRSSSPSRPENSESSFSTTRTKNRQKSPEKHGKNIKRQLSPTGKRFPHYQPYIHSLMHPDQLLKSDNYKTLMIRNLICWSDCNTSSNYKKSYSKIIDAEFTYIWLLLNNRRLHYLDAYDHS